jgi:glutamine cyclotransferase
MQYIFTLDAFMQAIKKIIFGLSIFILLIHNHSAFAKDPLDDRFLSSLITSKAPIYKIDIQHIYARDATAYTQGLTFHNGFLYESTGLYGQSTLNKKDIKTGKTIDEVKLGRKYFGEGNTVLGDKIYQLTWQEETGFIYDLKTLKKIGQFTYAGEGWGLTSDSRYLIMSNGSAILSFHNPDSFELIKKVHVHDGNHPVEKLNELEFIKGEIWANIFEENVIVRISPKTGKVIGWVDMNPLYKHLDGHRDIDVLNGIAYDDKTDRIFATGKLWPYIFEIKLSRK